MRNENIIPRESAFGRKGAAAVSPTATPSTLHDDLKLFVLTFAGGFLFVSLYLA
jgi:hypothetical protein